MQSFTHTAAKVIAAYFIMLLWFFVLTVITNTIPRSAIETGLQESVDEIAAEGDYPAHGIFLYTQDNFTDCVMMNIAAGVDASAPVQSAMRNTLHISKEGIIPSTQAYFKGQEVQSYDYARYWHGNQVTLRPLLCMTNNHGIRIINYILITLLTVACIFFAYTRISRGFALTLAATLAVGGIVFIPLNMQFVSCFYIMMTAMLIVMIWKNKFSSQSNAFLFFFILGGITQFFDLLTTPIITLGFPLMAWCFVNKPSKSIKMVIVLSLMWLAGYASLWASKWVLAQLITGNDYISDALNSARIRTVGSERAEKGATTVTIALQLKNYLTILWPVLLAGVALLATLYWRYSRPIEIVRNKLWLLLIAAMPIAWFCVLTQHTFIHFFFTWRIFLLTLAAGTMFLIHTLKRPTWLGGDK